MNWLKVIIAALMIMAASDARAQPLSCPAPAKSMLRAELLFGRNIGGRLGVSERQWARYLARELTPRFPDGLSVIDAAGQWRDAERGVVVREPSKIVVLVLADDVATRERLAAAVAVYKQRFKQQSVAVLTRPVCAAF
jgi:hypothetical protein